MNKTYLTAYLLTNGLTGLKEGKNPPELIPKERISLVATTTEYTKEEVKKILEDCDFGVAKLILEETYGGLDHLPSNFK